MLLEKLRHYADRLDLPPPMYQKTPIRWLIDLDYSGNLVGNGLTMTTSGKTGKNDKGKEYQAPHIGRTAIRAKLLADTGEYVLGIARDPKKQNRVNECHKVFIEQVQKCVVETEAPPVNAVLQFLKNADRSLLTLPDDFDPSQVLTFRVEGELPIDLPSVQAYWASAVSKDAENKQKDNDQEMQCLICGEFRPPVKRLPFKIKRIPGGQPAGTALISANKPAFESYGLEASLIAPTCQDCGERFSKAANALIQGEDTHITIGPLVYLFWTKEEVSFSVASLLSRPEPDEVRNLISSVFRGGDEALDVDDSSFYATALSASGGRVVVRDWLETTVQRSKHHLARYFALQQIVDWEGSTDKPFGWYALSASTVRDVNKELPANTPKVLLHMALNGGPLPRWLLFQVVKRNRAEQKITRPRAALIKMVLLSKSEFTKEDTMVQLDLSNREPAYLCGRLLAVLESIQRTAALRKKLNTTITDRFFGTASSAPASVFGRLIRGSQAHLTQLRKTKRGVYNALQRRLEEVQGELKTFPKVLTLEEQGLFGLGYYHQRAAERAEAIANKKTHDDDDSGQNSE
ncbi:MAG: type I-C CRISPR-associated protein Cas8c/Csd1 [Nitrospira sp.]|nr:type I-C CRISPR-associated protein Cas8c/Csd1 [Nitrospira sp.]MDE0503044.1 type I-C CRISPR-associated protein Cas8c/Csd1 [Candidatus Poribacteria bacterium]